MQIQQTLHIKGRDSIGTWTRVMQLLMQQHEIIAGEDYIGSASMTRDAHIVLELDEEAIEEIYNGAVHPAFESGERSRNIYEKEFTYFFVYNNWHMDEKYKFVYNYMDRFINYPIPIDFAYQGTPLSLHIPEEYVNFWTNGFDQLKWIHDAIRKDGISRRHQIITWIPAIDCFNTSPPCAQRIWIRVLVPKSEWHKYPDGIPVETHLGYRSWDVARALPSNLYGLVRMLYRYVFGNVTPDTEYIRDIDGKFVPLEELVEDPILHNIVYDKDGNSAHLNNSSKPDFKIVRLVCDGDAGHIYEDSYPLINKIVSQ